MSQKHGYSWNNVTVSLLAYSVNIKYALNLFFYYSTWQLLKRKEKKNLWLSTSWAALIGRRVGGRGRRRAEVSWTHITRGSFEWTFAFVGTGQEAGIESAGKSLWWALLEPGLQYARGVWRWWRGQSGKTTVYPNISDRGGGEGHLYPAGVPLMFFLRLWWFWSPSTSFLCSAEP